jgi:hypothetical protein
MCSAFGTQIRATDAAGTDKLVSTLGTGDALLAKINTELKKQGLEEATGASAPAKPPLGSTALALSPAWTLVLVMHVYAIAMWF